MSDAPKSAAPRLSVVVAARRAPPTIEASLSSLREQRGDARLEILLADGSEDGALVSLVDKHDLARHVHVPGGNLPALKGAAVALARGDFVAILDPSDAAEPDWALQIEQAMQDPNTSAVGGTVLLAGSKKPGNVAAYLFEYGAFNPPVAAGATQGDLPGNNVAYRRRVLLETCSDILAQEGFNKPFLHERIRETGGQLVIHPTMRVRHLTEYPFLDFSWRRFHYGRCFGAVRVRRASTRQKALYRTFAPAVPTLLVTRHLLKAYGHSKNRELLRQGAVALCGVCAFWGVGEWLGYWFGAGRSCKELY